MRVAFLLHGHVRSGGAAAIYDHARRLGREHGVRADVVLTDRRATAPASVEGVDVVTLAEARPIHYDVIVGGWWETVASLFELRASRRTILLQSGDLRYYREHEAWDRLAATTALLLPYDVVVVARWMEDLLRRLRPGIRALHVPLGIDKALFAPRLRPDRDGPLRVLVEGQPSIWFKGVDDAVRAVRGMREPHELTVVALDPGCAEGLDADRVVGDLAPAAMADLYAETDVLVKLARFEGFGLAPLEAFHVGTPCVVTPYTGHEDYVVHGENGLVVGFDDPAATARALDLLARDPALRRRLREGAIRMAAGWPSPQESTERLLAALRDLREPTTAAIDWAFRELLGAVRASAEIGRTDLLWADRAELAGAHARIEELSYGQERHAQELSEKDADWSRRLDDLVSTRAYRAAVAARRVIGVIRR